MMLKKEYGMILVLSLALGLLGGALASFLFLSGPVVVQEPMNQSPKVISAEEFQLVDTKGKPRAFLALSSNGEPYLTMLDRNDIRRVWLGLSEGSGQAVNHVEEFRLVDTEGKPRAFLALSPDGEPYLTMLDRNDIRRVWLGLSEDSGLAVNGVDGQTRLALSLDATGKPSLVIKDR